MKDLNGFSALDSKTSVQNTTQAGSMAAPRIEHLRKERLAGSYHVTIMSLGALLGKHPTEQSVRHSIIREPGDRVGIKYVASNPETIE